MASSTTPSPTTPVDTLNRWLSSEATSAAGATGSSSTSATLTEHDLPQLEQLMKAAITDHRRRNATTTSPPALHLRRSTMPRARFLDRIRVHAAGNAGDAAAGGGSTTATTPAAAPEYHPFLLHRLTAELPDDAADVPVVECVLVGQDQDQDQGDHQGAPGTDGTDNYVDVCAEPLLPSFQSLQPRGLALLSVSRTHWLPGLHAHQHGHDDQDGPTQDGHGGAHADHHGEPLLVTPPPSAQQILHRIRGVAFPSGRELAEWRLWQQEIRERDHRRIGQEQKLFMLHHRYSPGSIFLLPHGHWLLQRVKTMLRREYRRLGYQELATPLLYHTDLWKCSGHWDNYREDMFTVDGGGHHHQQQTQPQQPPLSLQPPSPTQPLQQQQPPPPREHFGLKPMNCPAHCLVYKSEPRSFRDLPLRLADFTPLHRNELSGTLSGLTRLRQFHQDDGHIFCRADQLLGEIHATLAMIRRLYHDVFRFPAYTMNLSTRPPRSLGATERWQHAEQILEQALVEHTQRHPGLARHQVHHGAGAFYGPKIDVAVVDSAGRHHQTATIQLDFQLPERFDLEYTTDPRGDHHRNDGAQDSGQGYAALALALAHAPPQLQPQRQRPVLVHRAVLGSLERFWALWMEECKGKWPFWCSPRQAMVIAAGGRGQHDLEHAFAKNSTLAGTSSSSANEEDASAIDRYAQQVQRALQGRDFEYRVDVDRHAEHTLARRIRSAHHQHYNYIVVVGKRELRDGTVTVRQSLSSVAEEEEKSPAPAPAPATASPNSIRPRVETLRVDELLARFHRESDPFYRAPGASASASASATTASTADPSSPSSSSSS